MALWRRYEYKCTRPKCQAKQTSVELDENKPIEILQCWSCRAGFGMDLLKQIATQTGAALVGNQPIDEWGAL